MNNTLHLLFCSHFANCVLLLEKGVIMVYSTSRCPHCKNIVKQQTNPLKEIACPLETCPYCKKPYLNKYKEEWITKSPFKRHLFFIQNGTWARALILPMLIAALIGGTTLSLTAAWVVYFIGSISWFIAGYCINKNKSQMAIRESLKRTESAEYVSFLKNAKYIIYNIEGVKTATKHDNIVENVKPINITETKDSSTISESQKYFNLAEQLFKENDIDGAIKYYCKSSELGNDDADISLGYIYLQGKGKRRNKPKAIEYFKAAQLKGNQYATKILEEITKE